LALQALDGLAVVLAQEENLAAALALSLFVRHHPAGEQRVREKAAAQAAAWRERAAAAQIEEAETLHQERSLAAWIEWATGPDLA
jgi:hypothetical protein